MITDIHKELISMKADTVAMKAILFRIEIQLFAILVMTALLLIEPLAYGIMLSNF